MVERGQRGWTSPRTRFPLHGLLSGLSPRIEPGDFERARRLLGRGGMAGMDDGVGEVEATRGGRTVGREGIGGGGATSSSSIKT
jgi:hypothetical protein